ncbi:ATP-binding cassette domain-containing protein [Paenibacillus mendelii]|uniref:ATP-binding cassette domain-containing protein n=1 Tax=Paenibacillus mendelii TaxID=206163 RepID=A0ABV6JD40_9BACL|nr:ATP-binding cassette domain-containing protein [Paenibacillus mendelii]MCQ6562412.1 ATP-binding cassette domain-containing protein [Paenibacillus mendelii]
MASSLPAQSVDESADDPRRAAKAAAKPAAPSRNSAEDVIHRKVTRKPEDAESLERVSEEQESASRSASGSTVTVRGGTVRFGEKIVLESLELSIRSGEFLVVVGRSGCGKSTLLRLIAGLEKPVSGSVSFDGKPSSGLRSDVRIMFQDARLLPWKSVLDNVRIGVPDGDRDKALEALQLVGLAERASEWPSVLSGGQRQRVALARALASSPRLLLLDEPLGALDALTRIEMQQLIERLWRERGFTAVLVTHDVSEAVALADRVILVEQGGITLDTDIALSRPREHDSGFAHYEKLILDRVLTTRTDTGGTDGSYTI